MEDLAITAVIPLYNGAEFIAEALNSVLSQTLPPAKINVVDDGSTDNGPEIVASMAGDHDISLIRKQNGGQSSARNLGIAHAGTPLIALLDQDDIWYPNHLEELVKPFRETRYPELGWVYSNLDEIDRDGRMVTRSCLDQKPEIQHPKRSLVGCLTTDMFILPTSSLISRDAFEAAGGFDERLSGYEDDDLFLRMFRLGYDNMYIDKALARWRIFSGSASYSPRMGRSRMIYLRKLIDMFPPDEFRNVNYVRQLIAPRFCPWLLLEYRAALAAGDRAALRATIEDLEFLSDFLPRQARLVLRAMLPLITWRPTSRMAEAMISTNLKLVNLRPTKTIVRIVLGLPPPGAHGSKTNSGASRKAQDSIKPTTAGWRPE
jgi:glycosyltransferase involved in cell wall biosynthesis